VCHETAGEYSKERLRDPGLRRPELEKFAQSVGPTSRRTCGVCHFAGGGAIGVKHGDIDPTLEHPDIFVDVHMDANGLNFSCATCHAVGKHGIQGSRYAPNAVDNKKVFVPGRTDAQRTSCQSCHSTEPHLNRPRLNHHSNRIACQTCHIPKFSRGDHPTKTWWDWSTAGRLSADGKPLSEQDLQHNEIYSSKKGTFAWERNVIPEYVWFDGTVRYVMPTDVIDPSKIVVLNEMNDAKHLKDARIWPMKIMRGKQPYDKINNTLLQPLTVSERGYWTTFDWKSALTLGQQAVNQPFSGEYDFVETRMLWPINHMVAPKAESLKCNECHSRTGRLATLSNVYIPGRDRWIALDNTAFDVLILTIVSVIIHAILRWINWKKRLAFTDKSQSSASLHKIYLFTRFERFWHWGQALLIILMLVTGFEIHGSYSLLGFRNALLAHEQAAWILIGLWIFAIFWHFITGEWRQYLPTLDKLSDMIHFYLIDIFAGKSHPFHRSPLNKLNPLQRLTYLGVKLILSPLIWISGLLLITYSLWQPNANNWLNLNNIAMLHTATAWAFIIFLIVHVYMLSTGTTVLSQLKAMLTGWEEIEK
jgi:octaheme c-type cytochrome (tetrathionate reductase family)